MGKCYLCTNPAWPGWTKVGVANSIKKRLSGYNTGTPFNDYEFKTVISFKHNTLLEDCVRIHFNGAAEPKEWINKPHDEVLSVFMDYKQKIEKNPTYWANWVENQNEEVEGDAYKYVKYGREAAVSKWVYKFTDVQGLELLVSSKELDVKPTDVDMSKNYTSRELAEVLNVYDEEGNPYNAKVSGWGKSSRPKYDWNSNLSNGMYNRYGIERISI